MFCSTNEAIARRCGVVLVPADNRQEKPWSYSTGFTIPEKPAANDKPVGRTQ